MCLETTNRRTTRLAPRASLFCLLAIVLSLGPAGAGAANSAAPQSPFFRLSPIQAVTLANQSGTRYGVTVSNAPVGNEPFARWYLDLPAAAADCINTVLPGGTRVGATRYVWKNQGTTFTWFHGAKGTYHANRSYGCDQTKIGSDGYPGTVTAVFENDSQHCTATFTGVAAGPAPEYGPRPVCDLGGYIPLPVPHGLFRTYSKVDRDLTALIGQAKAGRATGAAFDHALDSILEPQTAAFAHLFPPIWGCDFGSIFDPVLGVKAPFESQIAALAAGKRLPTMTLTSDIGSLAALEDSLRACRPTQTRPLGVPRSVMAAVDRLTAEATLLRSQARKSTIRPASLEASLRALDNTLNATITKHFPVVFGMPYIGLLDRVLAENSTIERAKHAAGTGDIHALVSVLEQGSAYERTIRSELRKQAERSAKAQISA